MRFTRVTRLLCDCDDKDEIIPDLDSKESFGMLKTKPRRIKERLGKRRPRSEEMDDNSEPRKSVKDRLGMRRVPSEESDGEATRRGVRNRLGQRQDR